MVKDISKNGTSRPPQPYHNRSEEMQDILTSPPSWMTRWGSFVIFLILLQLLLIAYFVKYPDILTTTIVLTSDAPTVNIVSKSAGKIKLLVKDNQSVQTDDLLGYIENPGNFQDVMAVKQQMMALRYGMAQDRLYLPLKSYNLGELQNSYGAVLKSYQTINDYMKLNFAQKSIAENEKLIALYGNLRTNIGNQINLTNEELKLVQKKHRMDSVLFSEQVISENDLNNSKATLIPLNRSQESYSQELMNNTIRVEELSSKITDIKIQQQEKIMAFKTDLRQNMDLLDANIAEWEQRFLFKAATSGRVSFFKFWSDKQDIALGETILSIVPPASETYGYVQLPMIKSGKVKEGQVVNIKFNSYPFEEYGIVKGHITSISTVPQNNLYAVKVSLDKGLMTTHNKKLDFKDQMSGNADIVTEDLRLLQRLMGQLSKLWQ